MRGPFHFNATQTRTTIATKVKFVSPFGTAQYPHISSPDVTGKFADGKYKTKLVKPLGDPDTQQFIKHIDDAAIALHGTAGAKLYKPYVTDEEANTATFIFKSQYAPGVFDSQNRAIPTSQRIGGGSQLRIMGNIVSFEKGISCQFNQVQVREMNGPGFSAFEAVDDGYTFEGSPDAASTVANDDAAPVGAPNAALDI